MLIPFTQLIFALSWIIETPCGAAAEMATVRHWRGFKDVPLKIVSKVSDSDRTLGYLKLPSLVNRRESHVHELVKRCIKGRCPQFFKSYFIFNSFVNNRIMRQMNSYTCQGLELT